MLLVDLGGGSCEITLSERKRIRETISLPLGAVRLTEEFLSADPPPAEGLARMRQLIVRELRRAHRKIQPADVPLVIGTSGTAAALSEACAGTGSKAASQRVSKSAGQRAGGLDGMVPTREVRKLAAKLARMTLAQREAVPGIGPRRAEIIVAGARSLPNCWRASGCADSATRHWGCATAFWPRCWPSRTPAPQSIREFEQERWQSVLATARRYGVDPRQAEPVRAHAVQLFRELKALHQLAAGV